MAWPKAGDSAHDLTLPDQDGKPVMLSALWAQGPVVLYFYPKDETAGCTAEACSFRDSFEVFRDAGAQVVGVSRDSVESHKNFAAHHRLPFTLLADVDGVDMRPTSASQAAAAMGAVLADRNELRGRLNMALSVLQADRRVDARRVAAIGYCFGGGCALELARSGATLNGVVSFHGALQTTLPAQTKPLARILVLHGAEDPLVDPAKVSVFMDEMRAVQADWQFVHYGNAVHSFTNPQAHDRAAGLCFDALVDARSWQHMQVFFAEIFA